MKDWLYGIAIFTALLLYFNLVYDSPKIEYEQTGAFVIPQEKGDSGAVVPGEGLEAVEIYQTSPDATEESAEGTETSKATAKTEAASKLQVVASKTKEEYSMDMLVAFWHGVAAVLLGEACAILIVKRWLKIKIAQMKGGAE